MDVGVNASVGVIEVDAVGDVPEVIPDQIDRLSINPPKAVPLDQLVKVIVLSSTLSVITFKIKSPGKV